MSTRSAILALPFVALAAAATAAPPVNIAPAFGNTVVSTYPDGGTQRIWLKPDGAWEAFGRRKKWSSGRWAVKAGKVCFKQTKPFSVPFRYCADFPVEGGVGAVWTSKDMSGVPITVKLVKGFDPPG